LDKRFDRNLNDIIVVELNKIASGYLKEKEGI